MAGRIIVDDDAVEPSKWDRFALEFDDGSRLALRDKRRLGRAVLDPDFSHVGPDAENVKRDWFREHIGAGHTAVKARLLNQHVISGIGNLLADELLWQARVDPRRDTGSLSTEELDSLRRALRAGRAALRARQGRRAHRSVHQGPPGRPSRRGRGLSPRRSCPGAGHRRRAHHVLVPGLPALSRRMSQFAPVFGGTPTP